MSNQEDLRMSKKEIQQITVEMEQCLQIDDPFPIDFDDAWRWIGYSTKQKARDALESNFEEGIDFLTLGLKSPNGGRPSICIRLANDCFKSFSIMAGTEKGKAVRRYFIQCEERLKALLKEQANRRPSDEEIQSRLVIACGTKWEKRFSDEFYESLSRLTGLPLEKGGRRPRLFAQLTNEFVYQHLPAHIHVKLRQHRDEVDGLKKLHQFLSEEGVATLTGHMEKLLMLMKAAETVNDLRGMMQRMFAEAYQCKLLESSRKDGRITLSKQALG